MKNLWLHGFYLSVIGVLGFQLWVKTVSHKTMMSQMEEILKKNNSVLNDIATYNFDVIEKQSSTNPKVYEHLVSQAKIVRHTSKFFTEILSKNLFNVEKGVKINFDEIKNALIDCSQKFKSSIDNQDSNILSKRLLTPKLLRNDTFWTHFKANEKAYLALLKNYVRLDELMLQNYTLDRFGCIRFEIKFDNYHVQIAPRKNSIFEGEKFEADVFLVNNKIPAEEDVTFFSEKEQLVVVEGFAHFSEISKGIGLKTVKIRAVIPNNETKEIKVLQSEFQYHVLPKCSQNCQ